jgi:hypothetical protein
MKVIRFIYVAQLVAQFAVGLIGVLMFILN